MGHRASRSLIQSESLDEETRTALWNVLVILQEVFQARLDRYHDSDPTHDELLSSMWVTHFKRPRDEQPRRSDTWGLIKKEILEGEWFDALDLLERASRVLARIDQQRGEDLSGAFTDALNAQFEQYLVAYRFIGDEIMPIDSSVEVASVDLALADSSSVAGARHSLERAVRLLADRQNPDYPNSVKESISAVEAITKRITGENTLGAGLKKLQTAGLNIHPALKDGWLKIYGWTSDENGVRHGAIDAATIDQTVAKYMLVSCSAFVSYLVEEGRKANLI
jgi:hypothetical protein